MEVMIVLQLVKNIINKYVTVFLDVFLKVKKYYLYNNKKQYYTLLKNIYIIV